MIGARYEERKIEWTISGTLLISVIQRFILSSFQLVTYFRGGKTVRLGLGDSQGLVL